MKGLKMTKKVVFISIIMVWSICFLTGCSVEFSNEDAGYSKDDYSRDHIQLLTSSEYSGRGYADDENTALIYVYNSVELREKYGDSFDIDEPPETMGSYNMFLPRSPLYKGTTTCYISINNDNWVLTVEKSYFGKWEVTACYLFSGEDSEYMIEK